MISYLFCLLTLIGEPQADRGTNPGKPDRDIPCDSLYWGQFIDYTANLRDTVIDGTKYVFVMPLAGDYALAFREYDKKVGALKYIELLKQGTAVDIPYIDKDHIDELYYDDILPSPGKRHVFFCSYYSTLHIVSFERDEPEEIIRFGGGYILDVEKENVVLWIGLWHLDGTWNYCDQWVVDGEVIFDPWDTE